MPRKSLVDFETEMDETARLILMVADDESKTIDIIGFADEFRKAHPDTNVIVVMNHWKKWHGNSQERPTHDYKTGAPLR